MNYERIMLELLERIQVLEEKVSALEGNSKGNQDLRVNADPMEKINLTARAREYIAEQKRQAKQEGLSEIILVCNDIQKVFGVVNRAPAICTAMYDCMEQGDEVLYAPSSGKSTAVKIKYFIHP